MLKRMAQIKKNKKAVEKLDKEQLSSSDLQHPILKKAKRRGTLTREDEKNLPFAIKLKCGKARKGGTGNLSSLIHTKISGLLLSKLQIFRGLA